MFEKGNVGSDVVPEFAEAITDFQELAEIYGHAEIVSGLVDLAVGESAVASNRPLSLENYSEEEQTMLREIFEAIKSEIRNRIHFLDERNQHYKIPEIEITYHHPQRSQESQLVNSPVDAYHFLRSNWSNQIEVQEEFNILFLDNKGHVLGIFNASKGGQTATVVDSKIILATALKVNSNNLILAHNHPSGNLSPSPQDLALTSELQEAAKLLDIRISDHLIVTRNDYFSFMQEGILEEEE